ncbi:MAG: ABC transporter ATP-binding protein [Chloroflexaceae bacterium]|nr:ABC transporter ATP-binding protein [Chloroflexaceae bacterium]
MTVLLEVRDLHFCYPGSAEPVLRGVSLHLGAGEKVALIGSNGSGKSTLLLHCNGILRPDRGQVRVAGQVMGYEQQALRAWRRQVGLIFQYPDDQLFSASVAQDISFGPLNLGLSDSLARQRVADAAALCGVTHLLARPTHALSGGEKTRVALAGVLAMEPRILLADEALSTLDPWMRLHMLAIFERLVAQGKSILLATHDLHTVRTWAERVIVMRAGQVLADAPPAQLFSDPVLLTRTGLDAVVKGVLPPDRP